MSAELRQTIRSILIEELAVHGVTAKNNAGQKVREEFVSIKSNNDLSRFVRRILDLTINKQGRADLDSGRHQFRLTHGGSIESGQGNSSLTSSSAVNFEQGLITEKQINNLPDDVTVVKLGKAARLTPLAQDAIRQSGVQVERVKS